MAVNVILRRIPAKKFTRFAWNSAILQSGGKHRFDLIFLFLFASGQKDMNIKNDCFIRYDCALRRMMDLCFLVSLLVATLVLY